MSAMDKCGKCSHPRHAHTQQPKHPLCSNCRAVKATKYNANHYFRTELEVQVR